MEEQPQPPVVDQAILTALEEQQKRYTQLIQDLKTEIDDVKKATTPPLAYTSPAPGVTQRDTRVMESMSLVGELQVKMGVKVHAFDETLRDILKFSKTSHNAEKN